MAKKKKQQRLPLWPEARSVGNCSLKVVLKEDPFDHAEIWIVRSGVRKTTTCVATVVRKTQVLTFLRDEVGGVDARSLVRLLLLRAITPMQASVFLSLGSVLLTTVPEIVKMVGRFQRQVVRKVLERLFANLGVVQRETFFGARNGRECSLVGWRRSWFGDWLRRFQRAEGEL